MACLRSLVLAALLLSAAPALGQSDCDFDRVVGTCTGTVRILKTSGSPGSYSAEIEVRSTANRCSRVEYAINQTPHQTVLANRRSDLESIFGTNPIGRKDITVLSCKVFRSASQGGGSAERTTITRGSAFTGKWVGHQSTPFGRRYGITITVSGSGSNLSGAFYDEVSGDNTPFSSASVSGQTLTFDIENTGGGTTTTTLQMTGANRAQVVSRAMGFSFSGEASRQ